MEFIYCYECRKFPCLRIRKLDKRYVENYKLSLIGNSNFMKQYGAEDFLKIEDEKWECSNCGKVLSVHRSFCLNCKTKYR